MGAKITALSTQVGELEEKNKKQAIEIKLQAIEIKKLKQDNERLNDKINKQDTRIKNQDTTIKMQSKQIRKLKQEKEQLVQDIKKLKEKHDVEIRDLNDRIDEKDEKIQLLNAEIDSMREETDKIDQIASLSKDVDKLKKQNEELLKDNKELKAWNKNGWNMLSEHRGLTTKGDLIDFALHVSIKKLIPNEKRRKAIETVLYQEKIDRNEKNHTMYERHVKGVVNELVVKLNACRLLTKEESQMLRKDLALQAATKYKNDKGKIYQDDKGDSPPKLDETRQDHASFNFQSPASHRSRRVH